MIFFSVDVCQSYRNLTSAKRKTTNKVIGDMPCDKDIVDNQWYRFQGYAGTRMPTACPESGSCGAYYPGWLDGDPPSVNDGEKKWRSSFVKTTIAIKISSTLQ